MTTARTSRRRFLQAAAAVSAAPLAGLAAQARPRRPNILIFLSDDHAQWLQGAFGNSEVKTPHLDALAARGVRMTNATTPSPGIGRAHV